MVNINHNGDHIELDFTDQIIARKKSRIPEKRPDGSKRPKSEHSDLYTDEDPKGTIQGLGFKDAETARKSVNIIEKSKKPHKHKVQATTAMEQRSRFAAKNAKDSDKKKKLLAANKIYKSYLEKLKKRTEESKGDESDSSLWENIRKKRERIKRGSKEKMRKKGDKGAPTSDQIERAKRASK